MLDPRIRRLLDAYPAIFIACHRRHVRDEATGRLITEHQAGILDHLHATRGTTLSKLAEHAGVGRSSMSIMVAKLVRRGYLTRKRSKTDGRSISLTLTSAGARIKEENTVLDADLVRDMFCTMQPKDLETALEGIELLARHANILLRRRKRSHDR
jgi:DNA-binding MarR family transcriptional regulator